MKVARKNHALPSNGSTKQVKPKYERLRQLFIEEIRSGQLKPGDMLPPEQQLAASYAIARSTVRQALAELQRDGLIQRIQGKGTFVHDEARVRSRQGLDVFALVLPETQAGFYPSLQRSFDEAAGRVHNQILVCQSNNSLDRQGDIILQLIDKDVAGVAIVPVTAPPTPVYQIRQIQKAGIPVVFCHRGVDGVRAPLLAIPFREVGRLAGRALAERGHRRVAFFSPQRNESSLGYLSGLRDVLPSGDRSSEWDIFFGPDNPPDPDVHESELIDPLKAVLNHRAPPTAIFTSFDSVAETLYLLLLQLGLRVPEDISLIGFGGTARGTAILRCITSVTVDEIRISHRAVELLDRMRRHELPIDYNEIFVMPVGLSDGQTLGPAPRKTK